MGRHNFPPELFCILLQLWAIMRLLACCRRRGKTRRVSPNKSRALFNIQLDTVIYLQGWISSCAVQPLSIKYGDRGGETVSYLEWGIPLHSPPSLHNRQDLLLCHTRHDQYFYASYGMPNPRCTHGTLCRHK